MRDDIIKLMAELKMQLDREVELRSEKEELQMLKLEMLSSFGATLNEKRKNMDIDIQTLEYQTGISSSTLKRLFKDPSQIKFSSVILVAETLGVKVCFAK